MATRNVTIGWFLVPGRTAHTPARSWQPAPARTARTPDNVTALSTEEVATFQLQIPKQSAISKFKLNFKNASQVYFILC